MTVAEYNLSVDKYSDNIYRFILKNLGDADQAKDIVQETYTKLWVRYADVSYEKVKSYLFTTAHHTMIDVIRKNKRVDSLEQVEFKQEERNPNPDLKEVLNKAVDQLPELQKSVLLLRDYEGYSYKEIEEITGLNESQVKVYIYRARKFLMKYIGSPEVLI